MLPADFCQQPENMRRTAEMCIIALLVLIGCTTKKSRPSLLTKPGSGGRSYEILVTGSNYSAVEATAQALRDIKMEGLPREEAAFEVSTIVNYELNQNTRYARNLVVVTTDSTQLLRTRFTFNLDIYAYPQLLIRIEAPSTERLKEDLADNMKTIKDEITRAEMNNAIKNLRDHHNERAEEIISSNFNCRLWIPEDLNKMKQGRHFLWFSNDGTSGMQNICIYSYAADSLSPTIMLQKRDSVMKRNIGGEQPGTYMATTLRSVSFHLRSENDTRVLGARGLWEMEGDNMGGPFVSIARSMADSVLCIEGFVYAPEMNKRNLIRRLEAALYTLKITD